MDEVEEMTEVRRSTYSVKTTGVGRPDYSPAVAASKLIVDTLQSTYRFVYSDIFDASELQIFTMYTVPAGYKLNIGAITGSCDGSVIQRMIFWIVVGGVPSLLIDDFRYDVFGDMIFGPESAVEVEGGNDVELWMYNLDTIPHVITLNVEGFLERVS